jgi:tetratricopeptide (TPR) repeat protein
MEVSEKISPTTPGDQLARAEVESSYSLGSEDLAAAQQQETDDYQVAIYEEQGIILLEEGQYLAALHEFQKVYDTDPAREQIREYMSWAHYRQGEVLFQRAEYLEARRHFEEALSFDEQCTSCKEYLNRTADAYKEAHYLRGIQFFEEEKLKEAIEEWQLVSELDSDYKQVQSYLLRAQNLLEKVQELKEVP